MSMQTNRPIWYRIAVAMIYLLMGAFLWRYLSQLDVDRLQAATIQWPLLVVAWPASIMARELLVVGWREILLHYENQVPRFAVLNSIYAKAWLARYVPGKVWYHIGKIRMAGRYGVTKEDAGLSSVLEVILQLGTGLAVGILLISASGGLGLVDSGSLLFSAAFLMIAAVLVTPAVFNRVVAVLISRFRSQAFDQRHFITGRVLARLIAIYTTVHLVTGLPVLLLLSSIYNEASIADYPFITGVVVVSGVLGALAFFAPSGIGVRESVQLILLSEFLPPETALIFVVLLRLWAVFVDLCFWGGSTLWLALIDRRQEVLR